MADIKSETIALGALFQCCTQIQRIASTGYYDEKAVSCVLRALAVTDPKSVEDIYNPEYLTVGFKQIIDSLGKTDLAKGADTIVVTKMALKLITLAHSVERNQRIYQRLSDEIDALSKAVTTEHSDFLNDELCVSSINTQNNIHLFGSLYQSIISPNFAKLLIYGDERFLRDTDNQERIRALLLAGIRAVILWRQVGGRRRYLIFRRKEILKYARMHV